MTIDLYQVDAFAEDLFKGNPAAVCPLDEWLPDETMQQIAMENNLSETAFFVEEGERFRLRWFTPTDEVDLCGHATLASAHVLFEHLEYAEKEIVFDSNSGELRVRREDYELWMDFPATVGKKALPISDLLKALRVSPLEVYKATDYMVVVEREQQVRDLNPNISLLDSIKTRGIIVTAPGDEVDFVSRFFAPAVGVDEDPVTGSAHTMLAPYWAKRLDKKDLLGRQISRRGGNVRCKVLDDRVEIGGRAVTYMVGQITV